MCTYNYTYVPALFSNYYATASQCTLIHVLTFLLMLSPYIFCYENGALFVHNSCFVSCTSSKTQTGGFLSTVCFDVSRSIRSQAVESVECHYLLPGISVMTCQAWNKEQASEKPLNGPGRGCD